MNIAIKMKKYITVINKWLTDITGLLINVFVFAVGDDVSIEWLIIPAINLKISLTWVVLSKLLK